MKNLIQTYLYDLERELRRHGTFDPDTLTEIESHLYESMEDGLRRGLTREEAETDTLKRFGSIKVISLNFSNERIILMQKIMIAIAALAGLFSLYVDTRPTWDDTGVLAGAILFICGVIAMLGYQRPWLLALAVGAWIPLYGILVSHNFGSIIALIIAFIGAYAGWAFRIGIRKTFKIA